MLCEWPVTVVPTDLHADQDGGGGVPAVLGQQPLAGLGEADLDLCDPFLVSVKVPLAR